MVLKFFLLAVLFLFTSCSDLGERDNPDDPDGINYVAPSSSSVPSSSSSAPTQSGIVPGPSVTDGDGNTYKTVIIGSQTWMASNLNYAVSGSKCGNGSSLSDANTATCNTYGRLYNWATAMALDANCNSSTCSGQIKAKHQGICPSGWHIPSDAEWITLTDYVGGASTAGKYLKAESGWNSGDNGNDKYGFSALPGGRGYSGGYFDYVGYFGYWWSASEYDSYYAYYRSMDYDIEYVFYVNFDKYCLFSVRCVQD